MEVRILGPLEVLQEERSVPVGGARQRALLAILVTSVNEVVSTDRLVEDLWGESPPKGVTNALHAAVSRLRRALEALRGGDGEPRLLARPPGYVLEMDPETVDARRFERLVAEGRRALEKGDPDEAAELLGEALALWRGTPLADFTYEPFAQAEIARLEELRLAATEERIEAHLALDRQAEVVGELEVLVEGHPFRERLRAQLMLALYRSGRQAEALEVSRRGRERLSEEFGIDPGPELRELEAKILRQEPSLQAPSRPVAAPAAPILAPLSRPEVRKTVTVVFADLAGSTSLGEGLDPEVLREVMGEYFEVARDAFHRHGGVLERSIGSAVLAVFGLPRAHEDDALRAVRAAVESRDALAQLGMEIDRYWGARRQARVGIGTGEVIVGDASGAKSMVTGAVVDVSARLQRVAGSGEILIDSETYGLVQDAIVAEPAELRDLRGIEEPVRAHRVLEVRPNVPGRARPRPPLVGRQPELALLASALDGAVEQRICHLVTVLGFAGVGKSRLVEEFLERSRGGDVTVLRGRCLPYGDGITFWPIGEIVRQAARLEESDSLEEVRRRVESLLGGDEHRRAVAERILQLVGVAGTEGMPQETFWAIRKFLQALAARGSILLVIDDLQWAEPMLLDLLEYLAALLIDVPVLILCLGRSEFAETRPAWGDEEHASLIHLGPLPDGESRELLRSLLGAEIARDVEDEIVRATDGNPLFMEETVTVLVEEGVLRRQDGGWVANGLPAMIPAVASVNAVLAARLDALPPDERAVIDAGSVLGEVFHWSGAAALCPGELRPAIGEHLQSLSRKQLIRPAESDLSKDDAFRFRHLLIRDVAYQGIPKAARADLHRRAAEWLERAAGDRIAQFDEIFAYHLEQAYRLRAEIGQVDGAARELASRAADILWRAGGRAFERGDSRSSVALLDRALSMTGSDDPRRPRLLIDLFDPLWVDAEYERAQDVSDQAIEVARRTRDRGAEWRARVDRADLDSYVHPERTPMAEVLRTAEHAIRVFELLGSDRDLARAWTIVAHNQVGIGQCDLAEAAAQRALDHVRKTGRVRDEMEVLEALSSTLLHGPTPVEEALPRGRALLDRSRRLGAYTRNPLLALASLEAMSGRFARARELVSQAVAGSVELGDRDVAMTTWYEGQVEALAGDETAAESRMRRACEISESSGNKLGVSIYAAGLARLLCRRGRLDEAASLIELSVENIGPDLNTPQIICRSVRARIHANEGRFREAKALAEEAVELARETDGLVDQADALLDLAEVLYLAGERERAMEQGLEAVRLYEQKGHIVGAGRTRRTLKDWRRGRAVS